MFDSRTLLEQWVWQNGISSQIFQSLNPNLSPIEKLKFSTCYAISKFYLTGAPLKPFNPILGETFQAKLNNSTYYLEQTSHHPCIMNFYAVQPYNTIYGYEQADASTSANSVTVHYKGKLTVEFKDKTKNVIVYPTILLNRTMIGTRKLCFKLLVFCKSLALFLNYRHAIELGNSSFGDPFWASGQFGSEPFRFSPGLRPHYFFDGVSPIRAQDAGASVFGQ